MLPAQSRNPEHKTILERIIGLIPLDYWQACVLVALVFGTPGYFVVLFLDGRSFELSQSFPPFATEFLFVLVPLYMYYMPRYMRLKVVALEPKIVPILTDGEEGFHRAFHGITATGPVLILSAVLGTIALPLARSEWRISFLSGFNLIAVYLAALGFCSYLWVYASSSIGLYKLGKSGVRLTSFLEDRMMGVQPVGALSLTLAIAYFGGLLLLTLLFSSAFLAQPPYQALLLSLLLVGILMFFLPLTSIHREMLEEKARQQRKISAEYLSHTNNSTDGAGADPSLDLHKTMKELLTLQRLEMSERRAANTPTWPFNIQLVGKLVTIVLSVAAVLISRLIITVLRL